MDGRILELESFTADLFSSGSKEMKEVIQLITRLMNLVIGALDQVEQQINRLGGRIGVVESRTAVSAATPLGTGPTPGTPGTSPIPGTPGGMESGEGGIQDELRSAIAQRPGTSGDLPSAPIVAPTTSAGPGGGAGWQPGFDGLKPPEPTGGAEPAPPTGGLGIRAALQSELKEAFKKLKSSMDTEE